MSVTSPFLTGSINANNASSHVHYSSSFSHNPRDGYISPLLRILSDLRRKHAAAAGPQTGVFGVGVGSSSVVAASEEDPFLMEFSVLPLAFTGDVDVEDMARRLCEEENDESWQVEQQFLETNSLRNGQVRHGNSRKLFSESGTSSSSLKGASLEFLGNRFGSSQFSIMMHRKKSISSFHHFSFNRSQRKSSFAWAANSASTTSSSQKKPQNLSPTVNYDDYHTYGPVNEKYPFFSHDARTTAAIIDTRASATLPSHADNLLCYTPYLRHISPASAEMQGESAFIKSRNPFHLLSQAGLGLGQTVDSQNDGGSGKTASSSSANGSIKGGVNGTVTTGYRTCLARQKANQKAAMELAAFVRVLAHEMSLEEFAEVENEIFKSILELMHSSDTHQRLAGTTALDALIGVASSDEEKKATKFAKNLSCGLKTRHVDYEFLSSVTKALGRMALGAANVDFVECEVTRALEWLKKERSDRRLAAVLTLKELAQNAPTAFYSKTNQSSGIQEGSNEFIDYIFPVLRDPQPIVRVCAADALSECLKILVDPTRKHHSTTGLLCQVYSNVMHGFKQSFHCVGTVSQSQVEAAEHASLLVVGDMLEHTREYMLPRFDEVCRAVLALKDHPKALLQLEVIRLIPKLARRCPGTFGRRYLETSLNYILESASSPPTQRDAVSVGPTAFIALGQLALAMSSGQNSEGGLIPKATLQILQKNQSALSSRTDKVDCASTRDAISYHMKVGDFFANLDRIFALVRNGMGINEPYTISFGDTRHEALHCAADLVQALGSQAEPFIADLLNDMFESGLSEDLIRCLHSIAVFLPNENATIEKRLMQELSLSLAGTTAISDICDPLTSWRCRESFSANRDNAGVKQAVNHMDRNMSEESEIVVKLVLSLRTLGSIRDTNGYSISHGNSAGTVLPFIRDVVAQYLSHPCADVRREAALTCCLLLLPQNRAFLKNKNLLESVGDVSTTLPPSYRWSSRLDSASSLLIEEVLQKLLRVAVSDPSPVVRHCVIRAFDIRYDPYLCQAFHLPPLFLLLQDETLAVRAATLRLLGRLARLNPAPILPDLRKALMELIIELRCSGDTGSGKENATRLLIVFLRADALHRLVHPFLNSIIDALPLQGVTPRLTSVALEALGELAKVTRLSLKPWLHKLLPFFLETLQDQSSSSKQRASLRTLGLIAAGTDYVVTPYLDYPQLLAQAADVLPATKRAPWALRREVIRTLGILGALDPDRYDTTAGSTHGKGGVGSGYFIGTDDKEKVGTRKRRNITSSPLSLQNNVQSFSDVDHKCDNSETKNVDSLNLIPFKICGNDDGDDEPAHLHMYEQYAMTAQPVSKLPPARRLCPSDEEFYPTVALQALTRILKDSSLAVHHDKVMQAVMYIFYTLGLRCVPFLKRIVPHILHIARTTGQATLREALLQQLASLSKIVRNHLSPYVSDIFEVVEELWSSKHLATILVLVEKMSVGVLDDFKAYLPRLIPRFLSSIEDFNSLRNRSRHYAIEVDRIELIVRSIKVLRGTLGEYMHLLVPAMLKLIDSLISPSLNFDGNNRDTLPELTVNCVRTISFLLQAKERSKLSAYESNNWTRIGSTTQNSSLPARAAQPLIRMLGNESIDRAVGLSIVECICVCARQLGRDCWMSLYNLAARDSIYSWQKRMEFLLSQNASNRASIDGRDAKGDQILLGINFYDKVMKELMSGLQTESAHLRQIMNEFQMRPSGTNAGFENKSNLIDNEMLCPQSSIPPISNQASKYRVNQALLQRAWDVSQRATREDWDEWIRRFAVQLLKESPAPSLRATAELAYVYQPLARELFSAAFACCWSELNNHYKSSLIDALKTAFISDVSPEILQTLLNLAEFMEHDGDEGGLPIEIDVLAELALKCRSYAKALHYKEREHIMGGGGSCIADLISINQKLDLPEAALGVSVQVELERHGAISCDRSPYNSVCSRLKNRTSSMIFCRHGVGLAYSVMATTNKISARLGGSWTGVDLQESWLAGLGSWSDALTMYERKLDESPGDVEAILGCMKCLDARGEWKRVLELAKKSWTAFSCDDDTALRDRRRALKCCAEAAWRLGQWDDLDSYSRQLVEIKYEQYQYNQAPRFDYDGAFYSAILNIHSKKWSLAADFIDAARKAMDSRFTALLAESHKRAYPSMVIAQTLAEMEEIISFRKLEDRAKVGLHRHRANRDNEVEARKRLLNLWKKRLVGCRVDAEVHSSIIAVRSLVLGPTDDVEAIITLSALSRQAQAFKRAERVLLDPLEKLGANLNGCIFGVGLPSGLKLGLLQTRDSRSVDVYNLDDLDHLLSGEAGYFFPKYGTVHQQYNQSLIEEAGGLEKLKVQHKLFYAYVKHLWALGQTKEAMERLESLADVVDMIAYSKESQGDNLRVSCWLKLGEWKIEELHPPGAPLAECTQIEVLMAFKRAIANNSNRYRAWHAWALVNFRLAQQIYENRQSVLNVSKVSSFRHTRNSPKALRKHVIAAVQGFVEAICLGTKRWSASVQQDLLNFLTCLFRYGELTEVANTIKTQIGAVTLEAWLGVLPQLLARIHIKSSPIRSVLHPLLIKLGEKHPQALMYPLSVLLKSPVVERMEAAVSLMKSLKQHSYALVDDALMVSSELIRVAILWLEQWHEGLEYASRLYFGERNVSGMLEVLLPLHEELDHGPSTKREQEFHASFGRDLAEAHNFVKEYVRLTTSINVDITTKAGFMQSTNQIDPPEISAANAEAEAALSQAWDLYYTVFRRINKQLPGLTTLELSHCSPALLQAHNLELGVPGSYRVDGSYVKIERFIPSVQVITSKQRPRKIVLRGGDGKDYVFLLKGHEDLRQDERVMQLFGLVNALLARDRRTNNHDLNIQRYTIAPLSHNAGVVGWVGSCDTFHSLVRDYRESKRIPVNMESREMLKRCPDYDLLMVMQKVEIFSEALDQTTGKGNDLYEVLWTKSTNSEEWLERRTKFTRSLAVMSMVGYILGLGDRHPSNLMLDQISGRVLHIDFGDCFEVAMHREKFPEKIPFRLTQMLIKAMEVSGIEGSYRSTCERTMAMLRDNRDSLVAMLEAFVYDPLISWRLLDDFGSDSIGKEQALCTFENESQENLNAVLSDDEKFSNLNVNVSFRKPIIEKCEEDNISGRSYSATQGMVQEPIRESNEDNIDDDEITSDLSNSVLNNTLGRQEQKFSTEHDLRKLNAGIIQPSQKRSLQMYSNIQSMAATVLSSSRIASITGDGTDRLNAEESLAQSRLSVRRKQAMSILGGEVGVANNEEALTEKALKVIRRVQDKLNGSDFANEESVLRVEDQVQRLIVQATSTENLCQLFIGWCAFW